MDHKKSPNRRSKRQTKVSEDSFWDCSVCTYRNTAEAFKCLMCDVRKGTSTRKPRINPQLVAQQVAQQYNQPTPKVKRDGLPSGSKTDPCSPGGSTVGGNCSLDAADVSNDDGGPTEVSSRELRTGLKSEDSVNVVPNCIDKMGIVPAAAGGVGGASVETGSSGGSGSSTRILEIPVGIVTAAVKIEAAVATAPASSDGTGGRRGNEAARTGSGIGVPATKVDIDRIGGSNTIIGRRISESFCSGADGSPAGAAKGASEGWAGGGGAGARGGGSGAVGLVFPGSATPAATVAGNGVGIGIAASDFPAIMNGAMDIAMLRGGGGGLVNAGGGGSGTRPSSHNNFPPPPSLRAEKNSTHSDGKPSRKTRRLTYPARPKLKNIDRSSAQHKAVTVNNVTVIITEFQPKRHQSSSSSSEHTGRNTSSAATGGIGGAHGPHAIHRNGCATVASGGVSQQNGNHSDSTNLSNDSHSDGRSS